MIPHWETGAPGMAVCAEAVHSGRLKDIEKKPQMNTDEHRSTDRMREPAAYLCSSVSICGGICF